MSEQPTLEINRRHPLPPMILHPFTESTSTVRVLENAKASLSALKDGDGSTEELAEMDRQLLDGRYAEVPMLFYVGKDVFRWLEQCIEGYLREPELANANLQPPSFVQLLIKQTPGGVIEKLKSWGVVEYPRIFFVRSASSLSSASRRRGTICRPSTFATTSATPTTPTQRGAT